MYNEIEKNVKSENKLVSKPHVEIYIEKKKILKSLFANGTKIKFYGMFDTEI